MVGVAVIGLGVYGEIHARTYASTPGVELVGVCDVRDARANALATELGCRAFVDYASLLAEPGVDAVSVALPDHLHAEVAIAVLNAGKHALVEKPLAIEPSQCLAMIRAADANGVRLMTDFAQRWSPPIQHAKRAIDGCRLGTIQLIYYRAHDSIFVPTKMLSWGAKSTVAWFLASHCLDNLLWLFDARSAYSGGPGDTISRLRTLKRSRVLADLGYPTADFYITTLEWASGMVTTIENCWILPESGPTVYDMKMEFIGSSGNLLVDGSHNRTVEIQSDKAEYLDTMAYLDVFGAPWGFATESIKHFVSAIDSGSAPRIDGVDGLAVTRLIQAMEASAAGDAPVEIHWNPYDTTTAPD